MVKLAPYYFDISQIYIFFIELVCTDNILLEILLLLFIVSVCTDTI